MKKKITAFLLILTLLAASLPMACAESVQPRFSHINSMSAGIDLEGSSLWCFGQADSKFVDTTTRLYVRLLRQSQDGGTWGRIAAWSDTTSSVIPAYVDETITVEAGYNYQVYVLVQICDASNKVVESKYMYSRIISYRRP